MAVLISPGVDVQIIDESFYSSAGPGTVPLIIVATASNKTTPSGEVASYTVPSLAGSLFLATSQRELVQNFGAPTFKSVQGTPVQGYELNEFGLDAAYRYLGISNRAYVLRADIDLAQLEAAATPPVSAPASGTYWFDLSQTAFGIFRWVGDDATPGVAWQSQSVLLAAEDNVVAVTIDGVDTDAPAPNFGSLGNFAVVVTYSDNALWEKKSSGWLKVGTDAWKAATPTVVQGKVNPAAVVTTDTLTINGTTIEFSTTDGSTGIGTGVLTEVIANINAVATANASPIADIVASSAQGENRLLITSTTGGSIVLGGSVNLLTTLGLTVGTTPGVDYSMTSNAQYPANKAQGSVWMKGLSSNRGAQWVVKIWNATLGWVTVAAPFYPLTITDDNGTAVYSDTAASTAFGSTISTGTIYVGYNQDEGVMQLRRYGDTGWANLSYQAMAFAPVNDPAEGTFWFNGDLRGDIMYGNGMEWSGYKTKFASTDPKGIIFSGSEPTTQTDSTALVTNDLWIDTSDLENYPMLYRYDAVQARWNLIDNTDQTSPFGIVFADARQTADGATGSEAAADMLVSEFLDPDAPDATLYPDGMLLFNTRYSSYNVKTWQPNYFKRGGYDANTDYTMNSYQVGDSIFDPLESAARWVTASGNNVDGTPYMGRKAQRVMIVRAMGAMIAANEDIRSELVFFNLVAAPGYSELIDELVVLNTDQKETAFILADTPARLAPSGTDVSRWASNYYNVPSNGEKGLTSANTYVGVYYPWGLSTDLNGMEVMIPPSTIALNTLAYNDQVAYPWYAPAGFRRGLVTNANSVGYLTSEGEFKPVILNQGQRDVLYSNKINPIAYIPGRGLVVYGQKTLNGNSTAMDRINVARLANYLKYNLDNLVKPFLFEQNDAQTRAAAQGVCESFLNGLVGLRALEDYVVICDESNNTPARRDAGELWIDIAIKPLHAIEFIYIPVRMVSSATDLNSVSDTF
jgi:hypothetical protein